MKKRLLIGFILGVALISFCSPRIIAGEEGGRDGQAGPPQMRAEDYPLGDIPLDEATFRKYFRPYPEEVLKALPASYDARSEGIVSSAKNQGSCGSCWAFASAGALESHIKRTYPAALLYDLSEQQQVSCNTSMSGCSGGSSTAVLFWQDKGPNTEADYPYASGGGTVPACNSGYAQLNYRVSGFYTTSGTENYKASLYDKGPSYWRFTVHQDFQDYWNGSETKAYLNATDNYKGGHAVLIIGWDDDKDVVGGGKGAFLCKNSWGASGGPNNDGTFWIAYTGHANDLGFGMCNFDAYDSTLPATLTVTSPDGGENWTGGEVHAVTWSTTGTVGYVKIEYSADNGASWTTVTGSTTNDGSYSWTVPDTPSAICLVRVSDAADNDPTDSSDAVFTISPYVAPAITVTAPVAGAQWQRSETYAITWLKQGAQNASVKIQLYKGTTLVKTITSTTANDGQYDWLVPADLAVAANYFIRVKTVDGQISDDSDPFSVIKPAIAVTAPAAGAVWVKNTTQAITWTKQGTQDAQVKIQLYKGTGKKLDISLATENDGAFDWLIPAALAGGSNYTVRVITLDNKVTGKSGEFAIAAGRLQVTAPASGAVWQRGAAQAITWSSEGTVNPQVKVQLFKGTTLVATLAASTENDGSFEWTIPAGQALSDKYKVRIKTIDGLIKADSGKFSIVAAAGLALLAPNGGEALRMGESYAIRWTDDPNVLEVKLEFSRDNGGTYATIADHVEDTGQYEWQVPVNFTKNGIVRVSDANGRPWQEDGLLEYAFRFLYEGASDEPGMGLWFGASDVNAPSYGFGRVDIGSQAIGFGGMSRAVEPLAGSWHELRIRLDLRRDTAALYLDDEVLFEHAALGTTRERYFEPGLVVELGGESGQELLLDDVAIRVVRQDARGEDRETLCVLKDDFERYDAKANPIESCWQAPALIENGSNVELNLENIENRSLRLRSASGGSITLRLPFSLPERLPCDISDMCLAIENR